MIRRRAALSIAGPTLTTAGNQDAFVMQLSPAGSFTSSQRFGDALQQLAAGIAVTPLGSTVIVGAYAGTPDFGNGPLPVSQSELSPFIARL